jgi:hypothetical protein
MNRMQHTARLALLATAPVAALAGWLWLQPGHSTTVFGAPAAGGGIPQCPENSQNPVCSGTAGAVDEEGNADENREIPLVPAAAVYPLIAASGYGVAHAVRRRRERAGGAPQ